MQAAAHVGASSEGMVSLTRLKQFALKYLKKHSTVRASILSEPDSIPMSEFWGKASVYWKLINQELLSSTL